MKIGFDLAGTKSGPRVFLTRLRDYLEPRGMFHEHEYDAWLNLSFMPVPDHARRRRAEGKARIIVRCDGRFNIDITPHLFSRPVPALGAVLNPPTNRWFNRHILANIKRSIADQVIYQSLFSKNFVEAYIGPTPVPAQIVLNGVDLCRFFPAEHKQRPAGKGPIILVSHYFKPKKRAQQAPWVLKELLKTHPDARMIFVGNGFRDTLERIQTEVRSAGVESAAQFLGRVEPDELAAVYRQCDLMLCLSYEDPCPNVVVEAIACGLPVVFTNAGGTPEITADAGIGVSEGIDVYAQKWFPHFSYAHMPHINPSEYAAAVLNVYADLEHYRSKAAIRRKSLDIENTARQYTRICKEMLER